jgi:hypothetical protein
MAVFDTMRHIRPDVSTVCIGMAASMGAFLLASGQQGKRYSLPNSRIMIHQPLGGAQGQVRGGPACRGGSGLEGGASGWGLWARKAGWGNTPSTLLVLSSRLPVVMPGVDPVCCTSSHAMLHPLISREGDRY